MWKVKTDSSCGVCHIGEDCKRSGISDEEVYVNLASGIKYAFIHDRGECGCMCEVELDNSKENHGNL